MAHSVASRDLPGSRDLLGSRDLSGSRDLPGSKEPAAPGPEPLLRKHSSILEIDAEDDSFELFRGFEREPLPDLALIFADGATYGAEREVVGEDPRLLASAIDASKRDASMARDDSGLQSSAMDGDRGKSRTDGSACLRGDPVIPSADALMANSCAPSTATDLLKKLQVLISDETLCQFLLDREPLLEVSNDHILAGTEVSAAYSPIINGELKEPDPLGVTALIIPHCEYIETKTYATFRMSQGGMLLHRYLLDEDVSRCFGRGAIISKRFATTRAQHDPQRASIYMLEFMYTPSEKLLVSLMDVRDNHQDALAMVLAFAPDDGTLPSQLLRWGTQSVEPIAALVDGEAATVGASNATSANIDQYFKSPAVMNLCVVNPAKKTQSLQSLSVVRSTIMETTSVMSLLKREAISALEAATKDCTPSDVLYRTSGKVSTEHQDVNAVDTLMGVDADRHNSVHDGFASDKAKNTSDLFRLLAVEVLGASYTTNEWLRTMVKHDEESSSQNSTKDSERVFKCELCGFEFRKKNDLKRHVDAKHLTRRDFACTLCTAKFGRESNLRRHSKALHGSDKPYVCRRCNAAFSVKSSFDPHITRCQALKR
uniref:C2H2-type domain-containing protein n=1 Tax=Erythrolobus australicus TaxID=1077150 RepID=A0A6T5WJX0_9RHOD|mmetsp:Transcript_61/g.151  ORF Transcript_61/g.151 Transcript_61/m.151 type:complete len:600 (+) Transcript_61:64-1863(+)